jgi:hypothetical protein
MTDCRREREDVTYGSAKKILDILGVKRPKSCEVVVHVDRRVGDFGSIAHPGP